MDSAKLLYSPGSEEYLTPEYAIRPLFKYVPKDFTIWCPFDYNSSAFCRMFQQEGYKVIHSHISEGKDFFTWKPEEKLDIIISNPPFKNKRKFFERALSFNKPIMLLMNIVWLNDKYSKQVFLDAKANLQLLLFDKRINFIHPDGHVEKKITFSSAYFCTDILPRDIVVETLERP